MEIHLEDVQGEEREGYYVQPLMKCRWAVQMDILHEIDAICRRHHIRYYGWYGTLLGAVRHHGYIPWDDDINLAMLRDDYERFQYIFHKEAPDGWNIRKRNPAMLAVTNTDVIRLDQTFLDRYHGCPYITGVDIFCVDYIPQRKTDETVWKNLFWAAANLYVHWDLFEDDGQWNVEKWVQLKEIEDLTGYPFDPVRSIKEQLLLLTDRIAAMYCDTECDEVTLLPELCRKEDHRILRACFDRTLELPFEDMMIPVLEDYDRILRLKYGDDYMTPVKTYAHVPSIKKQIGILQGYFKEQGKEPPKCFTMTFDQDNGLSCPEGIEGSKEAVEISKDLMQKEGAGQ